MQEYGFSHSSLSFHPQMLVVKKKESFQRGQVINQSQKVVPLGLASSVLSLGDRCPFGGTVKHIYLIADLLKRNANDTITFITKFLRTCRRLLWKIKAGGTKRQRKKIADYSQTGKCEQLLIVITGDYFKMLRAENIHTVSHRRKSTIR